jgi:hypothetical protein
MKIDITETSNHFGKYPNESLAKKIESQLGIDIDFSPSDQIFDEAKHVEYPQVEITNNEPY